MTIQPKPVRGEPFTQQMSQRALESWLDAGNRSRNDDRPAREGDFDAFRDMAIVKRVLSRESTAIDTGSPIHLTTTFPTPTNGNQGWRAESIALEGIRPTLPTHRYYPAIPLEPIKPNGSGLCVVGGLALVKVWFPTDYTWIDRCDLDPGQTYLTAKPEGSIKILYNSDPGTTGQAVDCVVVVEPPADVEYFGTAFQTISPGTSAGVVDLHDPTNTADPNVRLTNVNFRYFHGGQAISAGKELQVKWKWDEYRWHVMAADCEDGGRAPMTFFGDFNPAQTPYAPGSVVNSSVFLMHTPAATSVDPAPTPAGAPSFTLPDSPSWSANTDPGWVFSGNEYTFAVDTVISGYRVYIPTVSADHEYTLVFLDATGPTEKLLSTQSVSPSAPGWVEVQIPGAVFFEGEKVVAGLISENKAGTTAILDAPWFYEGTSQNGLPGAGGFNRNNQNTVIRIDLDDDNGTDQSVALASLVSGDVLQVFDGTANWQYTVISNDGVTVNAQVLTVALLSQVGSLLPTDTYTLRVERSGSTTDYNSLPNYWQTNTPAWASLVEGRLITTPGGTPATSDTAFATDLLQDDWNVPAPWEVVTISSREVT